MTFRAAFYLSFAGWATSTLLWLLAYMVRMNFKPGAAYDAVVLFLIIGWTLAASTLVGLYAARGEEEQDASATKIISGSEFGLQELPNKEAGEFVNLRVPDEH